MRRDTFVEAIRQVNQDVPFRRYTIELMNHERVIVYHPELLVLEKDLVIYEEKDGTTTYFDASCVARIVNVVIPPGAH